MRIVLIFLVITLSTIFGDQQNPCGIKDSCSSCIQNPKCVWCSDESLMGEKRCLPEYFTQAKNCKELTNPQNEVNILENQTLSNIVQIQPQKMLLKLKPLQPQKFQVNYKLAKDQPVDLYFLMDISESTRQFKETLGKLGKKIADEMKNITSDFRLGFGSFLDKTVMPFTSTLPEHLKEPCTGCIPPYSFRNHMPLDSNATNFEKIVADAKVSGNVDGPEGGFDGIMQAMVCQTQIGWRKNARRLLLVFTDSSSHIAGDGKLGGIIDRNDGLCHLDENGYYTHDKLQDYPSIPQINLIARRESINIIFVITDTHINVYEKIAKRISGSSSAKLEKNSSNILNIIRDQYKEIRSSVELQDDVSNEDSVKISYQSKCSKGNLLKSRNCSNLVVGEQVSFDIELELKSCTGDRSKFKKSINIIPVGVSEQLTIDLEYLCSCPCDSQDKIFLNSPVCRGNGNLKCGICECRENYSGSTCNCTNIDALTDTSKCIDPNNVESGEECNSRGSCVCGECKCEPSSRFFGKFCECDTEKCSQSNDMICSGPEQGICGCHGKCECIPPFTGDACECRSSTDTCISPTTDLICSGHGDCVCSECKCHHTKEGHYYFGKHCEHSTFSERCNELKNCVYCTIHDKICSETNLLKVLLEPKKWFLSYHCSFIKKFVDKLFESSGHKKNECNSNCSVDYKVELTDDHTNDFSSKNHGKPCIAYDDENCQYHFMYIEDETDNQINNLIAHKSLECPNELNTALTIVGLTIVILLIGIFTLIIWRFAVWIHDRKEYSKFQNEIQRIGMRDNPLYDNSAASRGNALPMKRIQI